MFCILVDSDRDVQISCWDHRNFDLARCYHSDNIKYYESSNYGLLAYQIFFDDMRLFRLMCLGGYLMTITGQWVCFMIPDATLPRNNFLIPDRPDVPITMVSMRFFLA